MRQKSNVMPLVQALLLFQGQFLNLNFALVKRQKIQGKYKFQVLWVLKIQLICSMVNMLSCHWLSMPRADILQVCINLKLFI